MSGLEQIKCAKCGRPHEEGERMVDGCCLACPQPVERLVLCSKIGCNQKIEDPSVRYCAVHLAQALSDPLPQRDDGLPIHKNFPCTLELAGCAGCAVCRLARMADDLFVKLAGPCIQCDKPETVNHPRHYNMGTFEVIDVIEDWQLDFNLGNAIKYIARAPHKGNQLEDLKKAMWYLDREIKRLETP